MKSKPSKSRLRLPAALLALMLILGGCTRRMSTALVSYPAQTRTLVLQVNRNLNRDVLDAIDAFADTVERSSEGSLTIEVRRSYPDDGTIERGEADLVLLSNTQIARSDRLFAMFSLPFLFDGSRHMTSALNSKDIREILEQRLGQNGVLPVVALYNGSTHLVTSGLEVRVAANFRELVAAMRTNNADKLEIFETLGALVLPYTNATVSTMLGETVEVGSENAPSNVVTVNAVEATLDQVLRVEQEPDGLRLINSYHTMEPLWLLASRQSYGQLTRWEQAVLMEGCASLTAEIEEKRAIREDALRAQIHARGIASVDIERLAIASQLYGKNGQGTELYTPPDYFDPRVYQMIQQFQ